MLGKTGGPPVSVVADVREATAEAEILYGAEFTGGTGTKLLDAASTNQVEIAKEILGLRASIDNAGALTEIGWTDVETKATKARLLFWWRLGRTDSALMRKLEQQAHLQQTQKIKNEIPSAYNWWRVTDNLVQRVANLAQTTPEMLRTMYKNRFRRAIGVAS